MFHVKHPRKENNISKMFHVKHFKKYDINKKKKVTNNPTFHVKHL